MDPGSIVGAVWTIDRTTPPVDLDARELLVTLSASGPSYVSDDASFAVWSATYQKVSPHLNAGYTWNRASVLAGNPATGTSADFSDQVGYTLGVDVSANPRLTLAFDVLGRYVIDSERLRQEDFHALDGRSVFSNIVFGRESFNALSGALGLKANLLERLLLDVNLLFKLDERGLRDKVTPLVGVEYAF